MLVQGAERAEEAVAPDLEPQFDRVVFQALVEGAAVEIARALIEQIGGEIGGAGLLRAVLARAAVESKIERDQRGRLLAHEPGLDAGRADDRLDGHRLRRARKRDQQGRYEGERSEMAPHERGPVSLIRLPVTERCFCSHCRAASRTSSAVTLWMRSGQLSMSATVDPVASDEPSQRAMLPWLSCV